MVFKNRKTIVTQFAVAALFATAFGGVLFYIVDNLRLAQEQVRSSVVPLSVESLKSEPPPNEPAKTVYFNTLRREVKEYLTKAQAKLREEARFLNTGRARKIEKVYERAIADLENPEMTDQKAVQDVGKILLELANDLGGDGKSLFAINSNGRNLANDKDVSAKLAELEEKTKTLVKLNALSSTKEADIAIVLPLVLEASTADRRAFLALNLAMSDFEPAIKANKVSEYLKNATECVGIIENFKKDLPKTSEKYTQLDNSVSDTQRRVYLTATRAGMASPYKPDDGNELKKFSIVTNR